MFLLRRVSGTVVYGLQLTLNTGVKLSLGVGPECELSSCTVAWRHVQLGRLGITLSFDIDELTLGVRYERSDRTVGDGSRRRHHYLSIGLLCLGLFLDWPSPGPGRGISERPKEEPS